MSTVHFVEQYFFTFYGGRGEEQGSIILGRTFVVTLLSAPSNKKHAP